MRKFMTAASIAALAFGFSGAVAADAPDTAKPVIGTAPAVQLAQSYGEQQKYREEGGQANVGGEADAEIEAGKPDRSGRSGLVKPSSDVEGSKQVGERPGAELDGVEKNRGYGDENRYRESGGQADVGGEADAEIE